jgi:O-antigen ligase
MKNKDVVMFAILLNIGLIILRLTAGPAQAFKGNLLSIILFGVIVAALFIFFISKRYDFYILTWIAFYVACPIINLPFTTIGSLGLLNAVFIPWMLVNLFNARSKYYLLLLAFIILAVLNVGSDNLVWLVSRLFEFTAPLVFFLFIIRRTKQPDLLLKAIVLVAALSVPLAIYEFVMQPTWGTQLDWRGMRVYGTSFWPNSYSAYMLPALVISYAFMHGKFEKKRFFLYALSFVLLLIGNILTTSRAGLAGLAIALAAYEFLHNSGRFTTVKRIGMIALVLIGAGYYMYNEGSFGYHFTPETVNERVLIWRSIWPLINENLVFGNGLGSYESYRDQVVKGLSPHNFYLELLFELGIVGLTIILAYVAIIGWHMPKLISQGSFGYGETGIAILLGILLVSIVGEVGFSQVVALNSWVAIGCCLSMQEVKE